MIRFRNPLLFLAYVAFIWAAAFTTGWAWFSPQSSKPHATADVETLYIRNIAPQYISDATIRNDIPAWEASANRDFAPLWHTAQVKLVFIGRGHAPRGAMSAIFVSKGDVQGALAYHTTTAGAAQIVVYAGTADYYGFSNSVSFTHELEEMLADPTISVTNQGWPYDWINVVTPDGIRQDSQARGSVWAQEVSDPVEAYSYSRRGADGSPVAISDFITPNWFNDEVSGPYDFMHLVQSPFTILIGGYAQFWDGQTWNLVENFRHAGRDARGFLLGERSPDEGIGSVRLTR